LDQISNFLPEHGSNFPVSIVMLKKLGPAPLNVKIWGGTGETLISLKHILQ